MTLTNFLLARIAEDEEQAVRSKATNAANPNLHIPAGWIEGVADRMLAECEAKRRVVEAHPAVRAEPAHRYNPDDMICGACVVQVGNGLRFPRIELHQPFPCPTLRALALPYADHPEYRDEWKT